VRFSASLTIGVFIILACPSKAFAIPIFAQRYRLACGACHTVLPELNTFGLYFRSHGYRLTGVPRHGTTLVALRYQLEYEQNPGNNRRYTPAGVILANEDLGRVTAFVHYNLGAAQGPAALYLAYLATYGAAAHMLYRGGLIELPLAQSPGQRLDDLQQYGYYGTHVGLNDLTLAAPRWGLQAERTIGTTVVDATAAIGEFKGAAYGGKPVATGETTNPATPEYGLWVTAPVASFLTIGGEALNGNRNIFVIGRPQFQDHYTRQGLLLRAASGGFQLQAEQWWGHDTNSDGFGTVVGSSGGYARLKYYPTPHSYLGIRYDAAANPIILRDMVYYGALAITRHVRFLVQDVYVIGSGKTNFGAAITIGFPWPLGPGL
jgi:hypothetical protein